ncbi:hypothetical protein PtA15_14A436 [Puccinia triticina]|uniref:Uncharacterized protein n=1 Tax=Puccinia triticina TaxID=208348 RepID=A0ABY7D4E1_9BASI|nr:uncharacterized protein PtA15_14A436 [Puccinia triticina]WAQ91552.1 hypothetical protein PtA15_14A436 [Puccinia triticina]
MVSTLLILLLIGQHAAVNAVPGEKIGLPEGQESGLAEYRVVINAGSHERTDLYPPPYTLIIIQKMASWTWAIIEPITVSRFKTIQEDPPNIALSRPVPEQLFKGDQHAYI